MAETAGDAAAHRRRIQLEIPGHVHRHRRAAADQPGDLLRREHLAGGVLEVDEQVEQLAPGALASEAHQLVPGLHRQHLDGHLPGQGAHLFEEMLADGLAAQGVVDQRENFSSTGILAQGRGERGRVRQVFDDAVQVVDTGRDGGAIVDAAGDHRGAGKQLGPVAGDQVEGVVVGDDDAVEPGALVFFPEQLEQPRPVGGRVVVLGVQVLDPVAGPHLGRVQHRDDAGVQVAGPGEIRGVGVEDEHARSLDRRCGGRKPGRDRAEHGEHKQDKGAQQGSGGIHGACLACRPLVRQDGKTAGRGGGGS